jgi:transcriptional regulator with XRE-family HTH domain
MSNMNISNRLQEERERLGFYDPAKFAQQCRRIEKEVIGWEQSKGFPDAPALERMAEAGLDVHYILTGRDGACSEDDSEMLSSYKRCSLESKNNIKELAEKEAEKEDERNAKNQEFMDSLWTPKDDDQAIEE